MTMLYQGFTAGWVVYLTHGMVLAPMQVLGGGKGVGEGRVGTARHCTQWGAVHKWYCCGAWLVGFVGLLVGVWGVY